MSRWNSLYCVWNTLRWFFFIQTFMFFVIIFWLLTTNRRNHRIYPSSIALCISQKSHKAYLIIYSIHVYVCAVDVKGFADETNKITKQLIFQNHQQTFRDFTCSPLTRIFRFFFSFFFIIRNFFSSLLFASLAHFYSESTLHGVSNTNEWIHGIEKEKEWSGNYDGDGKGYTGKMNYKERGGREKEGKS